MISEGVVFEVVTQIDPAINDGSSHPGVKTLPNWSTGSTLNKSRYPKGFSRDKLKPTMEVYDNSDAMLDYNQTNPAQRIQYLEKSIDFLREQHRETLDSLHSEIEKLHEENKDLQYQLVIHIRREQQSHASNNHPSSSDESEVRRRDINEADQFEEERSKLNSEIRKLRSIVKESSKRNEYLSAQVETLERRLAQASDNSTTDSHIATVQLENDKERLAEAQATIKQLQQVTKLQAVELNRLRAAKQFDGADIVVARRASDRRIELVDAPHRLLPDIGGLLDAGGVVFSEARNASGCTLPALPVRLGNAAVERRKRTQVLQKAKLRTGSSKAVSNF